MFRPFLIAGFVAPALTVAASLAEAEPIPAPSPPAAPSEERPVEAPTPPSVPPAMIAQLVSDLDSSQFERRRRATALLAGAGPAAITPLARIARNGSLEAAVRAIAILESFYVSGSEEQFEAAGEVLERLSQTAGHPVAQRAEQVLELHGDVRELRALAAIKRLGGIIKYAEKMPVNFPQPAVERAVLVHIGSEWTGGDEGLKHLKRVSSLESLYVSRSPKSEEGPVSKEAIAELQMAVPRLQVQERGEAYLGIRCPDTYPGCLVSQVDPDTPAERGGIEANDQIIAFGGKPTPNFPTLVELIAEHAPGDEIEVQVARGQRSVTLTVVLDKWKP